MNRAIVLEPYEATWPRDDPDAGFRQMVAEYSHLAPLPTLEVLSRSKGIPVGALPRFVLARYGTSGSDALLEMGRGATDGRGRPDGRGGRNGRGAAQGLPGAEGNQPLEPSFATILARNPRP